jgi:membrane fusion protein (multidrug efflux system)
VVAGLAVVALAGCSPTPPAPTPPPAAPPAKTSTSASPAAGGSPGTAATAAATRRATDSEKEKARQTAAEMVPVETALVSRGPISAFLAFNSTLETEAVVDLYPQITGQVEALLVEEGHIVKEGDPLLKIEDRELRVDADEATANFEQLKKNFARSEDLHARNLINKQDYETQAYQLEQARLRLERAKIRLSYTTVRAPFAGVVATRETQVGARVTTGSKLFSMVKLDEIVARVYVPGRYLPIVADNQPAVITSEFLPDRSFTGWVKRISPVIDPKSGTFKVTVGVRGEMPADLPPGLFVNVRVITDTRPNAVLIPKRALIYEGGERYIFTIVNDRAVKRKLAAGFEDPQNIEAVSGFEVGTPVIVLGQSGLKDGSLVRSVNAPPIAPGAEAAAAAPPPPAAPASRS